jgi:hypothetical protein
MHIGPQSPGASAERYDVDGRPLRYIDANGVVHACGYADVLDGIRLVWTMCDRDVPPNAAWTAESDGELTCTLCRIKAPDQRGRHVGANDN